jgi:ATP synthase protein I
MEGFVTIRNQKVIARPQTAPSHPMDDASDEGDRETFKPLTAQEAQALRKQNPPVSPWRVLGVQSLVGVVVAMIVWGVAGQSGAGWSAAYGALAVVIPGAVFARGLTSRLTSVNAGAAMLGFFFWEAVKIALTVAMLVAAPKVVENLSWPALLVGLVITMKAVWVTLLMRSKGQSKN